MIRRVVCALVALAPAQLHADGIAIVGGSPRAIGRAGTGTVGDDGGGALLINPAAMARRETWRVQLGAAEVEDSLRWQSDAEASAESSGRAGSRLAPIGAAIGGIGDWTVGAGVMTAGVSARSLPGPTDASGDLGSGYNYRYAGISGSYRRDTAAIGAARRIGDSVAVGVSLAASRVAVMEQRRVWAGYGTRDKIGSPDADVELRLTATDWFATSAVAGVMYAPVDAQIELGASIAWAEPVHASGDVTALAGPLGPKVRYTASPRGTLDLRQPITVRAGGRYVGDRLVAELDGDLWLADPDAEVATWHVRGVQLLDSSQTAADLLWLPSRISQHTHVAIRGALDVELMPGFLWATAGYAFSTLGTPAARLSPTFGDLGGHTLGLGLEGTSGGLTVTLGWSRTWSLATRAPTALMLDNPFNAGDGPVPQGTYEGSLDQIGVLLEVELGGNRTP